MTIQECECGYIEFYVDATDERGYGRITLICRDCGTEYFVNPTDCDGVWVALKDAKEM